MGRYIHILIETINYLYREFNPDKDNILTVDLTLRYKFIHLSFSFIKNTCIIDNIIWFRGDIKFTETKYFEYYCE